MDYLLTMSMNPDSDDVLSIDDVPYVFEEYDKENFSLLCSEEQEKIRNKLLENNQFLYDRYYEEKINELENIILEKCEFKEGDNILIKASPCNWRGVEGKREFRWNGDSQQFLVETAGSLSSDFSMSLLQATSGYISMIVFCHDIPTGSKLEVTKINDEEE